MRTHPAPRWIFRDAALWHGRVRAAGPANVAQRLGRALPRASEAGPER